MIRIAVFYIIEGVAHNADSGCHYVQSLSIVAELSNVIVAVHRSDNDTFIDIGRLILHR